jgi:16S rRNA (uracil1498-N3)-methyltransferase
MNLFYAPQITADQTTYIFDKDESRHITKVLRHQCGDTLYLTNGKGLWVMAEITVANPKRTEVKIIQTEIKPQRPNKLHVAMAPTKSNDRYEWFLEKATEIGIDEVTPLLCRYAERKKINPLRYDKILVAAMKQSLQAYKPKLNDLTNFKAFLDKTATSKAQKLIAYCKVDLPIAKAIESNKDTIILIGPEGGFSKEEIQMAIDRGFKPVSLSTNRLRTETAGVLAVSAVQLHNS